MGKKNKIMIDKEDKTELDRLLNITDPNQYEMDQMFLFFRKYIDSSVRGYRTDCNCSDGFIDMYYRLKRWYLENRKLFE